MSAVDYSNPLVTKQDLQRVEQRIQTNTTLTEIPLASASNVLYYDATTKAVSYNTAPGGGGGGAPICLVANHETAVTIPSSTSTIPLDFASFAASLNGFSQVGLNTFRWIAGRSAVFVATFVARVRNSNTNSGPTPQFVRVAAQLFTGSGNPLTFTPVAFSSGSCIVATQANALAGDSESTTEATLTICSTRFGLNNNQELQVRAGQNSTFASGVLFDGSSIGPGGVTYDSPAYTLYIQEVAG